MHQVLNGWTAHLLVYIQKAVLAIFVATYDIGPATLSHDLSLRVVESATIHHLNNPRPTSTVPLLRDLLPPCRDYPCFKAPSTIGGHAVLWVWSMLPQHHIFPSITHLRVTSDIIYASRYSIWLVRMLDQSKIACSLTASQIILRNLPWADALFTVTATWPGFYDSIAHYINTGERST